MLESGVEMKQWLGEYLVCPTCLPRKTSLELEIQEIRGDDVMHGRLWCPVCAAVYDIRKGVAVILPEAVKPALADDTGYNSRGMLSAYLWSHYCDLFNDDDATEAYRLWASLIRPSSGMALDIGCAVGRLSFEMSKTHSRVVGIDTSFSFIENARKLLNEKRLQFDLIIEGAITEQRACGLGNDWNFERIDFIVGDAMALPFADHLFSTASSVNILEKVPDPFRHLKEVNRVLACRNALFAFSDPFTWDETVSPADLWIGGSPDGLFSGRGIDGMRRLFSGEKGIFNPPMDILESGAVSWKIRKTENLREHIRSQFLVGTR